MDHDEGEYTESSTSIVKYRVEFREDIEDTPSLYTALPPILALAVFLYSFNAAIIQCTG